MQDMHSMIDAAKYADLVLLLIDAAFGFEMETFEFLNLLQVCKSLASRSKSDFIYGYAAIAHMESVVAALLWSHTAVLLHCCVLPAVVRHCTERHCMPE